jgi:hypothetical protein
VSVLAEEPATVRSRVQRQGSILGVPRMLVKVVCHTERADSATLAGKAKKKLKLRTDSRSP